MKFAGIGTILMILPSVAAVRTAVIYRGSKACDDCSESVGRLLKNSPFHFDVTYAGPEEPVDLSPELLSNADIYAYPGGPDVDEAWDDLQKHAKTIRDFVHGGGRYMGFCLGAYLAGKSALNLMPSGVNIVSEIERDNAQVGNDKDTTIQVDWKFNTSTSRPKLEKGRWVYFQEGATMLGFKASDPHVIARYSANQDVAASVTPYGKGFIGLVGPHPEAYELWYESAKIKNPEGMRTDIGYDFVRATVDGIRAGNGKIGS
ncbi:hypothetical protein HBI56_216790 [Parastagonospora nodorum]|uniref:Biotin-protein ligase N-terminal domain-containing protein n=2 Tax=Phaeosphaeria nodorum (strain SN15 / ATCC MYA-4574 / FGSC 10173) TaxID=321614 RepID=A0A7U2F028_PHANO|nr:hypothetical protein SNOG_01189 [Parastagonospora nodorum SN15]KAH3908500.1 hypothetical protein HBH56_175840 [Parastagonospora nodorum]EAT90838.1 hypothetical protein SNOG_01189 [Parastagonospora nodorum SN15]KAH3926446.1 hypothetical protein HBH54_167330 [Parastagonospora nodorum]KAH3955663.1 hypothetical protein HBH53_000140 [Parastagonospora nodorum]KAH3965701.1 hypothetical protein HBH52_203980 [Parastagonospora nodorum]